MQYIFKIKFHVLICLQWYSNTTLNVKMSQNTNFCPFWDVIEHFLVVAVILVVADYRLLGDN